MVEVHGIEELLRPLPGDSFDVQYYKARYAKKSITHYEIWKMTRVVCGSIACYTRRRTVRYKRIVALREYCIKGAFEIDIWIALSKRLYLFFDASKISNWKTYHYCFSLT